MNNDVIACQELIDNVVDCLKNSELYYLQFFFTNNDDFCSQRLAYNRLNVPIGCKIPKIGAILDFRGLQKRTQEEDFRFGPKILVWVHRTHL